MVTILLTFKYHAMTKIIDKLKQNTHNYKKKQLFWNPMHFLRLMLKFVNENMFIQLSPKKSNCTVKSNLLYTQSIFW